MSNQARPSTTTAVSGDGSSASFDVSPPRQLSLFKSTLATCRPLEAYEVTGPSRSGKSIDQYPQEGPLAG